jgi:phosphohistidine phosphatase
MQLLIVRHAIAEDRLVFAASKKRDDLRPLTDRGRERMTQAARGLHRLVPRLDLLATSPLVRAVQTAQILAREYACDQAVEVPCLAPGAGPGQVASWLGTCTGADTVALVGHEPDLSELIGWLSAGADGARIQFKKGAACLLDCPTQPQAAGCDLLWLHTPGQLRLLGEG